MYGFPCSVLAQAEVGKEIFFFFVPEPIGQIPHSTGLAPQNTITYISHDLDKKLFFLFFSFSDFKKIDYHAK